jgi:hypothetical protein
VDAAARIAVARRAARPAWRGDPGRLGGPTRADHQRKLVEVMVPEGGFGRRLDDMHALKRLTNCPLRTYLISAGRWRLCRGWFALPPDEVQPRRRRPARAGTKRENNGAMLGDSRLKPELHAILIGFAIGAIAFSVILAVRPASA